MTRHHLLLVVFSFACLVANAQNTFKVVVEDDHTKEKLIGVTVILEHSSKGAVTDANGLAEVKDIPDGTATFSFSYVGYQKLIKTFSFPLANSNPIVVGLTPDEAGLEEVVVSSTRTHSRIEDLPIKVEVLGQDDMNEESTIVPGGIGSILGDLSVITIQKTNPVNGNDAVRMQGLDYKYTQLLRDGLPLYEGFSGSLGVLSIPPLDLKQVEIIKGSASTLYGGGAIGGLINFISRTPSDSPSVTLTFNRSSLNESNFNTFVTTKKGKIGTTLFAGANLKQAYDVNKDGFAEVPEQQNFIFHPRLFFYPHKKVNADVGLTLSSDNRKGGDMTAINYKPDSIHSFLFTEKILRTTVDGHVTYQLNEKHSLTAKATGSLFDRKLFYDGFNFSGKQLSTYTELNHLYKSGRHTLVSGVNFVTENFKKEQGDTVHFNDYTYRTLGFFSQEDWQIFRTLSLEGGIRADYHNRYHWFVLPRIGLFYRPTDQLSVRLHYGTGYKIPNLFTSSQPADYPQMVSISNTVKPELSNGVNMDINYHILLFNKISMQLNQAFYYTHIANPTLLFINQAGEKYIDNAGYSVKSVGTDTYIRLQLESWELYLGYNHTEAKQLGTNVDYNMPFNPKDKFATTLAYEIHNKWRMGIEAAYNANQYVYNNARVPNYWFYAGMIERKFNFGSLVLNCENIGNYRQSNYAPLVTGTTQNPVFASIWGPVEGRVINLSLKIVL